MQDDAPASDGNLLDMDFGGPSPGGTAAPVGNLLEEFGGGGINLLDGPTGGNESNFGAIGGAAPSSGLLDMDPNNSAFDLGGLGGSPSLGG